ncbi:MAG: EamA family transporter [Clostridia bacterium]|nr:EamA family transporter [Clostridia bacterium]
MQKASARITMSISMAIFGTMGFFVRSIAVSSGELALYRAVLAVLFIAVVLIFTKNKSRLADIKHEIPLLLLSGIAMGINWILLFEAYKHTSVSVATLSYYFAPVIVMLVCPLLFKERPTKKQIICFIMSTLGIVLITGVQSTGGSQNIIGILFGLGAAAFYATVVLLNKFIKRVNGIQRTFLQFAAAIIILLPYVALTSGFNLAGLDTKGFIYLLIVGFVHSGFAYCLYFSSLKELSGQRAAILSYIDPLVAVAVSVTLLNEKMTVPQIIGGLLILGFTLFNEVNIKKKVW